MLTQEEEYSKGLKAELQESMQKYEDQMSKDQTKVQSVMKWVPYFDFDFYTISIITIAIANYPGTLI